MPRKEKNAVYAAVWDAFYDKMVADVRQGAKIEHVRFTDFCRILMRSGIATSTATCRDKWKLAVAQEVFFELGTKPYKEAVFEIAQMAELLGVKSELLGEREREKERENAEAEA